MSMVTLTVLQLAGIFCAYLSVTIGLPAYVLGRKMRGHRAPERLMFYFMTGNFYVINLVYALQLLKISNKFTLILGTVVPAVAVRIAVNRIPVLRIAADLAKNFRRLAEGHMGSKTAAYKAGRALRKQLIRFARWAGHFLFGRFPDCALTALFLASMWWMYGRNLLTQFGYKASDLLVHNYWINAMSDNHIFVAGVYPHGFHCVIYYLHTVFGIETFVMLRVFAFVENVMLHLMLLCFLRLCCQTRYLAYGGTILFVVGQYLKAHTYSRYYATLPQEFGMIFILPAVYFGFGYFAERKRELEAGEVSKETGKKRRRFGKRLQAPREEQAEDPYGICWEEISDEGDAGKMHLNRKAVSPSEEINLEEISLEELDLEALDPGTPGPQGLGSAKVMKGWDSGYDYDDDYDYPLEGWENAIEATASGKGEEIPAAVPVETRGGEAVALSKGTSADGGKSSRAGSRKGIFVSRKGRVEKELPRGKRKVRKYPKSWLYLAGFLMSFALTLTVHFYGTMVAGIFCMGMAVGYGSLFFRKQYFKNVVATVFLSVAVAILPMLLAFMGGTPLQGSLGWGMNIIMGTGSKAQDNKAQGNTSQGQNPQGGPGQESSAQGGVSQEGSSQGSPGQGTGGAGESLPGEGSGESLSGDEGAHAKPGVGERLAGIFSRGADFVRRTWEGFYKSLDANVFLFKIRERTYWVLAAFLILIGLGAAYQLCRQTCYGAMLMSTGFYMLFMCVMMTAKNFGLPSLMDSNRGSIYFSYSVPVALTLLLDGILYLPLFPWKKGAKIRSVLAGILSLVCVAGMLYYTVSERNLKVPRDPHGQEMNEAVICLTNIIKNEKDFSWTIVSANDEFRMGEEHGHHYETITFLEEMEGALPDAMVRIPTNIVYIFVEKIPIGYNVTYADSGQAVSKEGASRDLPANRGIGMYQGEKRWILMSRLYYWAQEFQKMYPDEMEVYLETDNFDCYRVEQNPNRLYNFAINYG